LCFVERNPHLDPADVRARRLALVHVANGRPADANTVVALRPRQVDDESPKALPFPLVGRVVERRVLVDVFLVEAAVANGAVNPFVAERQQAACA
jgi:hypothetical protein